MFVSDRVGAVSDTAGRAENNEVVQILVAAASSSSDWGCAVSKEINFALSHWTQHTVRFQKRSAPRKNTSNSNLCIFIQQNVTLSDFRCDLVANRKDILTLQRGNDKRMTSSICSCCARFTNVHRRANKASNQTFCQNTFFHEANVSPSKGVFYLFISLTHSKLKESHFVRIKMFILYF